MACTSLLDHRAREDPVVVAVCDHEPAIRRDHAAVGPGQVRRAEVSPHARGHLRRDARHGRDRFGGRIVAADAVVFGVGDEHAAGPIERDLLGPGEQGLAARSAVAAGVPKAAARGSVVPPAGLPVSAIAVPPAGGVWFGEPSKNPSQAHSSH